MATRADCTLLLLPLIGGAPIAGAVPVFTSGDALKAAVKACLAESSVGLCPNSQDAAIGLWDVSAVDSMYEMFMGASAFNQNLSPWDTSAVTNMGSMFDQAKVFNKDLSAWDTSAVISMSAMFSNANTFNQDLSA